MTETCDLLRTPGFTSPAIPLFIMLKVFFFYFFPSAHHILAYHNGYMAGRPLIICNSPGLHVVEVGRPLDILTYAAWHEDGKAPGFVKATSCSWWLVNIWASFTCPHRESSPNLSQMRHLWVSLDNLQFYRLHNAFLRIHCPVMCELVERLPLRWDLGFSLQAQYISFNMSSKIHFPETRHLQILKQAAISTKKNDQR